MAEWVERVKDGEVRKGEWIALPGIEDARLALDILKQHTTTMMMDDDLIVLAKGVLRAWAKPIGDIEFVATDADFPDAQPV